MTGTTNDLIKQPLLGKSAYDVAKDAITIWLPALATFYGGLALALHLPYSVEVVTVIGLLVTFLGTVLKVSSTRFNNITVAKTEALEAAVAENGPVAPIKGQLIVNNTNPEKENFQLQLDQPWDELAKLGEFRIQTIDESAPDESASTEGFTPHV